MAICKPQDYKIYSNTRQEKTTLISTEELLVLRLVNDPNFSYLLQHKEVVQFFKSNDHFFGKNDRFVPPYL